MPALSAVLFPLASPPIQRQYLLLVNLSLRQFHTSRRRSRSWENENRNNARRHRRPFHTTSSRSDDVIDNAKNHYETLKIAPGATTTEIKKAFYNLSKTHHPDLHEASARRAAAKRFMRISEAYSILSSPTKRAKYDREHMAHLQAQARKNSYASTTGPAGGRPASGLSRRRSTFTGPPPSFFRSGGWGAQSSKRKAAHEESTGGAEARGSGSGSGSGTVGGMGPGQDPFGHREDVPHFDRESHERTGRNHAQRRQARRHGVHDEHGHRVDVEAERGTAGMFFAIGGVLMFSFIAPFLLSRLWYGAAREKEKSAAVKTRG
ncbi:DnaJ-domain-containing protein [Poronia punctata]|nr:DnaJ-domain-containing protein [Poronia punctata]